MKSKNKGQSDERCMLPRWQGSVTRLDTILGGSATETWARDHEHQTLSILAWGRQEETERAQREWERKKKREREKKESQKWRSSFIERFEPLLEPGWSVDLKKSGRKVGMGFFGGGEDKVIW
jgi:hypothetical protein